jgi:hypothetical protein
LEKCMFWDGEIVKVGKSEDKNIYNGMESGHVKRT